MVNYFRYDYPQPVGDRPFSVTLEAAECPWHSGRRLVRIGLEGRDIDRRERPAGNLVFIIDVSGSMAAANKLPLVKQALAMLVEELTENDSVAIVTYAGDAGVKLPATSGDQKEKILAVIESLSTGGSTHGSAGINLAYEQAAERFIPGGANRVILATDGDLNVGVTSDEALVDLIKRKAAGGTFLTVLGCGEGNLQDAKMEKIADNGNGVYAYIDGAREARKVLVEQLTGSTITIAKDVKIQVEFNPAQVAAYRLIGYENRIMAAEDFRNDRKDAGEIGAGHSVTALYEIELVGDGSEGSAGAEPLKYQPPQPKPAPEATLVDSETSRELLTVKLRWKQPEGDASTLDEVPLVDRGGAFEQASADLRFACAVAAFGMVLRNSEYKGEATLPLVAKIATGALGPDRGGYRAEFLDLVRKAETLRDGGR
jgi:Ca-activated chloride channel homolog